MSREIDIANLILEQDVRLIDVRSPGEFQRGHIPMASNVPLFSDEERAEVGTVYKKQSQHDAIQLGYRYVVPKLTRFIRKSEQIARGHQLAIHCWRGGMRSRAFADHLESNGFRNVLVLKGGYKSFRNHVLSELASPKRLRIIGGYTGSGKTEILKQFKKLGQQVIDLEALAHHRGSAFGGIGQGPQPTVEQFENDLYWMFKDLDFEKVIWLEDESHSIGSVRLPHPLYRKMKEAPLFFLDIPKHERARYLVNCYGNCDSEQLANSIRKISRRLGDLSTRRALEHLRNVNYYEVAELALNYYDKSYQRCMERRNSGQVIHIQMPSVEPVANAAVLLKLVENHDPN